MPRSQIEARSSRVGAAVLLAVCVACQAPPSPRPSHDTASPSPSSPASVGPTAESSTADDSLEPAPEATPLPPGLEPFLKPFKGDLDGMVTRRLVRVLTVQNPILYFVDRGREVGMTYESIKAFEKQLNARLGNGAVIVHVVAIPVARDQLLPRLLSGEGDIAAAALTVTPERQKTVDFSSPIASGVQEVVVTSPEAPEIASIDELSGQEVYVRPSSSYAEHLRALNEGFRARGLAPVTLVDAPEVLEDGDILEMVHAGLTPRTVVDGFMADLYVQVFPSLRKGPAIGLPGDIAWAFRKQSPKLEQALDAFLKTHARGTLAGNVLLSKYLRTTKWVKEARSDEDRRRFASMASFFKKYSTRYDFDYLLMVAQAYQESGLDQKKRSAVGAVGVMQVMPSTARDPSIRIPDIQRLENNIHAGIKYNRWVVDNFYRDPAITHLNRALFAFASYNAGPGKVASLRREAEESGLDPNVWFNNVELVAARRIGHETVVYVSNIYKYYLAYKMMTEAKAARATAKTAATN
jgi:membrane-bound lytic murein transglycosylase MltF